MDFLIFLPFPDPFYTRMYVAGEYAEVNIRIMLVLHFENMIFRNISIDQSRSTCKSLATCDALETNAFNYYC